MTQPNPSLTGNAQQERVKRGARVSLESRKRFRGDVVQAVPERVVVAFPGTGNLAARLTEAGAGEVHLTFQIGHRAANVYVHVFLNRPDADASTPTDQSFIGAVGFFEDAGHGHPVQALYRLVLTPALVAAAGLLPVQVTFVPVTFAGRESTPEGLELRADIHLVRSIVEPAK
jgi:hypothetical protein